MPSTKEIIACVIITVITTAVIFRVDVLRRAVTDRF